METQRRLDRVVDPAITWKIKLLAVWYLWLDVFICTHCHELDIHPRLQPLKSRQPALTHSKASSKSDWWQYQYRDSHLEKKIESFSFVSRCPFYPLSLTFSHSFSQAICLQDIFPFWECPSQKVECQKLLLMQSIGQFHSTKLVLWICDQSPSAVQLALLQILPWLKPLLCTTSQRSKFKPLIIILLNMPNRYIHKYKTWAFLTASNYI